MSQNCSLSGHTITSVQQLVHSEGNHSIASRYDRHLQPSLPVSDKQIQWGNWQEVASCGNVILSLMSTIGTALTSQYGHMFTQIYIYDKQ